MGKSQPQRWLLSLVPGPSAAAWALLPLTVGPALGEALSDRSAAVARTGSGLAWVVWAVVLLAVVIPRTTGLTALRLAAPMAVSVAWWAALAADRSAVDVLAAAWAAALLLAAFAPSTGEAFANGSAYGDERRALLRVPGPLLLGPLPLTWTATVAGPVAAPLLLASEQWAFGSAVAVVGGAAAVVGTRALHGLSRRWVVLVPAGLVLHDLQAMADPVLFPRSSIARLGPALVDDPTVGGASAIDLTLGALGLALQLDLREPLGVAPRRGGRGLEVVQVEHLRFTPSRPGALLAEAARRRIAVG